MHSTRADPAKKGTASWVHSRTYVRSLGDAWSRERVRERERERESTWHGCGNRWIYPGRGRNRLTDGEPHVIASPVRLIAPLYQIHPRLGVAASVTSPPSPVVSGNIRVRSLHRSANRCCFGGFFCDLLSEGWFLDKNEKPRNFENYQYQKWSKWFWELLVHTRFVETVFFTEILYTHNGEFLSILEFRIRSMSM